MKALTLTISLIVLGLTLGCARTVKPDKPDLGPSETFDLTPKERVELALKVKDQPVKLTGAEKAYLRTSKGDFTFKLYSRDAPKTVRNFIRLARTGFYDGLIWHRYQPGFVIQGGDPMGTGAGGPGYTIPYEESGRSHLEGAVGMARGAVRNSASSQFYICLDDWTRLDGQYCIFGRVTDGMDVVNKLRAGNDSLGIPPDTIYRIVITH